MSAVQTHFSCENCGKQFRWKPEIAGRRAKCACGGTIFIPTSQQSAATEENIFEFVEKEPSRVIPIKTPQNAVPVTLGYQAAEPTENQSIDPLIDLGVSSMLLLAAAIFISLQTGISSRQTSPVIGIWILIAVTSLPWIGAFLIFGLISAKRLKISYASFGIAAYKILTISLVGDAAFFGVLNYLRSSNGLSPVIFLQIFWILAEFLIGVGVAMKASSLCLFLRKEDRFKDAGFTVAALTWVLHVVMLFAINSMFASAMARKAHVTSARAAQLSAPISKTTIGGSRASLPTDSDIIKAASQGLLVREGREWKNFRLGKSPQIDALIDELYAAGANKVYIDMRRGGMIHPQIAYVEFPADLTAQNSCLGFYQSYLAAAGLPPMNVVPSTTQRFTALSLR